MMERINNMYPLYPEYQEMINNGVYDSVEELCNGECLNYHEVYDYDTPEDDEDE